MLIINSSFGPRDLGHLDIDQRGSGIPVEGLDITRAEFHTYTCTHCNGIVVMHPKRTRERYKCVGCNHHICDGCAAKAHEGEACKTMQQRYEESLELILKGQ